MAWFEVLKQRLRKSTLPQPQFLIMEVSDDL
jgi:hypothetical protein